MATAARQQRTALTIDRSSLHSSLSDPALDSINFLNEIIDRFPSAISFAPGAPAPSFFDDLDVCKYIDLYAKHLSRSEELSEAQVRRRLYQYGPSRGLINGLVAEALRVDQGLDLAPEAIVITVGYQEAILLVLRALCASDKDVLAVVQPCFVGTIGAARVLDIETHAINEVDGRIDLLGLRALCQTARDQGRRLRAVYLAPDFSNPSGTVLDIQERQRLLDLADREDFLLLEDNAYGFTAAPGAEIPTLKALDKHGRVIYFGTFAKICLPGTRVGFVVADQQVRDEHGHSNLLTDELAAIKSMTTVNTSPICQAIIGGMILEHGGSLASIGQSKATLYQQNLSMLLDSLSRHLRSGNGAFDRVSWNTPSGGFFIRMRLPCVVDEELLEISARQYGVLWTPMSKFYLDDVKRNELRLSCSYLTAGEIEEGVRRLASFLQDPHVREAI